MGDGKLRQIICFFVNTCYINCDKTHSIQITIKSKITFYKTNFC